MDRARAPLLDGPGPLLLGFSSPFVGPKTNWASLELYCSIRKEGGGGCLEHFGPQLRGWAQKKISDEFRNSYSRNYDRGR